jgi:hypothetical protein
VTLSDVTGVFSRYFIVGFFIPAFFSLALIKVVASEALLPAPVEPDTGAAFLILGAIALAVGLLLIGLRDPILYLMSGYFALGGGKPKIFWPVLAVMTRARARRIAAFRRMRETAAPFLELRDASPEAKEKARVQTEQLRESATSAWRLDRCFPNSETKVLPTRLGNSLRAWEDYARIRWHLETVEVWTRIKSLLSDQESKVHADAETDLAFFVNSAILLLAAGITLAIDAAINRPHPVAVDWVYAIPFLASVLLYQASVGAAERWGACVRASIDIHRLDFFLKLGVVVPTTRPQEVEVGLAINQLLLYGWPLPDAVRRQPQDEE